MYVSRPLGGADKPVDGPPLGQVLSSRPRGGHLCFYKSSGLFLVQGAWEEQPGDRGHWEQQLEEGKIQFKAEVCVPVLRVTHPFVCLSPGGQPLQLGQPLQRVLLQRPPAPALQPRVCSCEAQDQPWLSQNRVPILLPGVSTPLPTPHELQWDLSLLLQRIFPQLQPVYLTGGHQVLLSLQKK